MISIREIDSDCVEGRLLIMAIGLIMSLPGYTDKNPDEILLALQSMVDSCVW